MWLDGRFQIWTLLFIVRVLCPDSASLFLCDCSQYLAYESVVFAGNVWLTLFQLPELFQEQVGDSGGQVWCSVALADGKLLMG